MGSAVLQASRCRTCQLPSQARDVPERGSIASLFLRFPIVICVQERDEVTCRARNSAFRAFAAPRFLANQDDLIYKISLDDFDLIVRASIIHHDDLVQRNRLVQDALERADDGLSGFVGGKSRRLLWV